MAEESVLKKEFKKRDVERARNLVNKDYTSKTMINTGYRRVEEVHKEGETWEEQGKQWTIKNGLKQNLTKLDIAKQAVRMPLLCPKCGGTMNQALHIKMYKIHGFCFDCTLSYEAELRRAGLFQQYEQRMVQGNAAAFLVDLEQWALDFVNTEESFVTEHGDVEEWSKGASQDKSPLLASIREYAQHLQEHLK